MESKGLASDVPLCLKGSESKERAETIYFLKSEEVSGKGRLEKGRFVFYCDRLLLLLGYCWALPGPCLGPAWTLMSPAWNLLGPA